MIGTAMAKEATVWFGTSGQAKGIYRASLDLQTGKLSEATLAFEIKSCGFVTVHPNGQRLYSLGSLSDDTDDNLVAFRIGDDHSLQLLNTQNSMGGRPTHLSLSHDLGTLLVAHYSGGGVASLPISPDGTIGSPVSNIQHSGSSIDKERQDKPHPHWIGVTPDNNYAFVPDLGTDEVVIYSLDTDAHSLTHHGSGKVPAGGGPRHLAFHPTMPWAYVVNELNLTVTALRYEANEGSLTEFQTAEALPMSEVKQILTSGSEIRMRPDGRFLYVGIRGHDVIAVFEINNDGTIEFIEREPIRGSWPRNFALDPTGRWLLAAGAESSTITVFSIDEETGRLTFTRQVVHVPECICVAFSR
jgi:6-phosphogluconolactonase